MAKVTKELAPLILDLRAPGLTPLLRTGIGGLAATLRAYAHKHPDAGEYPTEIRIGGGTFIVEPRCITLNWNNTEPAKVLGALFEFAFDIHKQMVFLPGMYSDEEPTEVTQAAHQDALKRTFLQHGKSTTKPEVDPLTIDVVDEEATPSPGKKKVKKRKFKLGAGQIVRTSEDGDRTFSFLKQEYTSFAHQEAVNDILKCLSAPQPLAGWAYPGAIPKHLAWKASSEVRFDACQALAAVFALVGAVSYKTSHGNGGALVLPQPSNLIEFGRSRPVMTPDLKETVVSGQGDAVLRTRLALQAYATMESGGVAGWSVVVLRMLPWAKQQKSRAATLELGDVHPQSLEKYARLKNKLPNTVKVQKIGVADNGEDEAGGYFVATSALRGFAAENIARGDKWYRGFATATVPAKKKTLYLHYYRSRDNKGALFLTEREGLIAMNETLDDQEQTLVGAVHTALRQRYGRIGEETRGMSPQARKNRFKRENERVRLSLANAKTQEQVRGALAELWSKAGTNQPLRDGWTRVLPMLRADTWQLARDLGLIALASYKPASKEQAIDLEEEVTPTNEKEAP